MRVDAIFTVSYGHSLELNRLTQSKEAVAINFVSRTSKNNGVSARVRPVEGQTPSPAGTLSVALGGSVLETFLQPSPYLCGRDVAVLTPKQPMSDIELLWWASCIRANKFRYNYGRQANRTLASLELPAQPPSWLQNQLMPAIGRPATGPLPAVDPTTWRPFRWDALFEIKKGVRRVNRDLKPGSTPFVRASDKDNGITGHYDLPAAHPAGVITIAYNGSVGETFYQPAPFFASDDVNVLYPRLFALSSNRAMFIAALTRLEKFRYNYGRKWRLELMNSSIIHLPVKAGTPDAHGIADIDWQWIDSFVEALPHASTS
jgi:hypothetical protein